MIGQVLLIFLCLAAPAFAAPVTVTSGEHDGFTRLVFDFGAPVDWQVGRTLDGYALQLRGAKHPQPYDLTKVFTLIGKGRLAAIWADPVTSQMNIGIACACHAIPFEFRPGILVIDLRDGAPPKGSSFELAMDGSAPPVLDAKPAPRPRARPQNFGQSYDWTRRALATMNAKPISVQPQTTDFGDPTLRSLRDSLLYQLSRGAAQGVVDLALPDRASNNQMPDPNPAAARIALGELPGIALHAGPPGDQIIAAQGQTCPTSESLDLSTWGTDAPIAQQMSDPMVGLIQEFDRPDPAVVARAVRFNLFLGFGIESRQLMRAFPVDLPDRALLSSLGYIFDQDHDPDPAFRDLAACGSAAALWAVLSDPAPPAGDAVNINAVLRAFSALPAHLRRHLGPGLAQRFLALNDEKTAMTIRNAVLRAPGQAGPQVSLMEAEIEMSLGDPAAAETHLQPLLADPGPKSPAALVALIEARIAQNLPVAPDLVTALESVLGEQSGTDQRATRRALLLAQAASGDFDSAFNGLATSPEVGPDLWRILSKIGSDQAVLVHAVLQTDEKIPTVEPDTSSALATRLLGLGFADQALWWLGGGANHDGLLLAQIHLARQDGQAALAALATLPEDTAAPLRAAALHSMGNEIAAAQAYADLGETAFQRRATAHARDWPLTAQLSPDDWGAVIEKLNPTAGATDTQPQIASLARGRQIAENAAQTRAEVDALLAKISAP